MLIRGETLGFLLQGPPFRLVRLVLKSASASLAARTACNVGERSQFMSWRRGEVWLDTELWLSEGAVVPAVAGFPVASIASGALPPGLAASRRRREAWERDRMARRAKASAIALSPAVMFALAALRADGRQGASFAVDDPPSLTFQFDNGIVEAAKLGEPRPKHAHRKVAQGSASPKIVWHHARSVGLPYGGSLVHGTQLPVKGANWVTWNPITDSRPNAPKRLYGNERTIHAILSVTRSYRAAHPNAPRVVIGDISRKDGGPMDDHVSHQNGLDVDVYFPRLDRTLRAPTMAGEVNHQLAQDLLERFVAAGAQMIFVGYSTGLHGPAGVVIPYPGHEYHMHVRFPPPGG
jgi:Penicillin-insensitive murein endopeptidase